MFARSPIAWTQTWKPRSAAARARASSSSSGEQKQPRVGRIVAVRRVERSAAGAEGAVRHELHGSDGHPSVAQTRGPLVERRLPGGGVGASERDVIPEGERVGRGKPAVSGEGIEVGAHLVDAGEADGQTVGDGGADRLIHLRRARARLDPPDELLGGVDQDARRLSGGVALQPAAGRIRRVAVDAGDPERGRVGPGRVAVDANQGHGMTRHRTVERRPRREARRRASDSDPILAR